MRVANSELFKNLKDVLIEKVKAALDPEAVKQVLEVRHNLEIDNDIECKAGDILIHKNRIVCRLEFEVVLSLSILLDSDGNYIQPLDVSSIILPEGEIGQMECQAVRIIKEKFNPGLKLVGTLSVIYGMGKKVFQRITKRAQTHLKNLVFVTIL